jgi:hypothetical protein
MGGHTIFKPQQSENFTNMNLGLGELSHGRVIKKNQEIQLPTPSPCMVPVERVRNIFQVNDQIIELSWLRRL